MALQLIDSTGSFRLDAAQEWIENWTFFSPSAPLPAGEGPSARKRGGLRLDLISAHVWQLRGGGLDPDLSFQELPQEVPLPRGQ